MLRTFLVALCAVFMLASATPPPPKTTFTFMVLLASPHSAVLGRPEGPCRMLEVLTSEDFPLKAPSMIEGVFRGQQLYLKGRPVVVEQFVTVLAPGCAAARSGGKAL